MFLVWALLGLPFVAFIATKLARGGLDHKYVLASVLAVPLGAGYILPRLNRRITPLVAILFLSILAVQAARFWPSERGHLGKVASPVASVERMVNLTGHPDLPVVVSDGDDYLPFVYYAPPEFARRFVNVVDPQAIAYIAKSLRPKGPEDLPGHREARLTLTRDAIDLPSSRSREQAAPYAARTIRRGSIRKR
jgi:hypothetical protein